MRVEDRLRKLSVSLPRDGDFGISESRKSTHLRDDYWAAASLRPSRLPRPSQARRKLRNDRSNGSRISVVILDSLLRVPHIRYPK